MTPHDLILLDTARQTHDWQVISNMIDQAHSQEAKERLASIKSMRYHQDEFHNYNNI